MQNTTAQPRELIFPKSKRPFRSQPDRSAEALLRAFPADGPAPQRALTTRDCNRIQLRFSDFRFSRRQPARVRGLLDRQLGMQVRQSERAAPSAVDLPQCRAAAPPSRPTISSRRRALPPMRHVQQEHRHLLQQCGDPVGLQLKYDQVECQERGMTYAAPLKVTSG